MADSLIDTLFGTLKSVTNNFDDKKIEEYTGEKIGSVDEFMARTAHTGQKNYGYGFLAGVVGGLVAVGVKMLVDREVAPGTEQAEDKVAKATVKGIEEATGRDIWNDEQEELVATFLEVGMGALIGGAYGLIVEAMPDAAKVDNEQLMTTTKQLAIPVMGLIPAASTDVATNKVQNLAGHTAFIGTLEVVRRTVRHGLETGEF